MSFLDYLFYITEVLAAISGLIYTKYHKDKTLRYFVYSLIITVFVETFGMLSMLYFDKWSFLEPYRDSPFVFQNYWLYNIYYVFNYSVYIFFFRNYLINSSWRNFLKYALIFYVLSALLNLAMSDTYFIAYSAYTVVLGTFLILISILLYFYEMLKSYVILKFYKNIVFYIAVGAIVFHLCTTPLFIFSKYFDVKNNDFVNVYYIILPLAIIFMYTCYTIGFVVCSKNKSY